MTSHREWFLNYRDIGGGKVILGNNHACNIKGIGDIKLKMHDGIIKTLTAVRYVSELKRNLISLGELDKSGYSYRGDGGVVKVARGLLICMKAVLQNGIYVLQATTLCGDAAIGENRTYEHTKL